jgi:tyrosyl-tRNA synthetase
MFGKIMSISDRLMWRYYLLLTDLSEAEIGALQVQVENGEIHPKQAKVDLALKVVASFHSDADSRRAAEAFEAQFARGELAVDRLDLVEVPAPEGWVALSRLVMHAGLAGSASDAARKIQQGGVRLNRQRATDPRARVTAPADVVLEVGRRAVRVRLLP